MQDKLEKQKKDWPKDKPKTDPFVYGILPPQSKDLEQVILGACMLEKNAFEIATSVLKSESFYVEANQIVFLALSALAVRNSPIDMMTVVEELIKMGKLEAIGGMYYIIEITKSVVSSAHILEHSLIVQQKFMRREVIRIGAEMTTAGYDDGLDVFDLLDNSGLQLSNLMQNRSQKNYRHLRDVMDDVMVKMAMMKDNPKTITGVPTGITELNSLTGGWQNDDLIILAARPSVGKSAVAGNLARMAAKDAESPIGVGIFSLEMGDLQIGERMLAAEAGFEAWRIKQGKVSSDDLTRLSKQSDNLKHLNILIDDSANLDLASLKAKARRMVTKEKIGLIIVDYLQLMGSEGKRNGNREQEISNISRGLKQLAKELHVPIIALSQLSRAVEGRAIKIPQLSDLRESGAIEQDADIVIFLVAGPDVVQDENLPPFTEDDIFLKFAKHRGGSLDMVHLKFHKNTQRIYSPNDDGKFNNDGQQLTRVSSLPYHPVSGNLYNDNAKDIEEF